jgi:hypothetical protein
VLTPASEVEPRKDPSICFHLTIVLIDRQLAG